jgi:chaperone required for assembly of F1-ATPase
MRELFDEAFGQSPLDPEEAARKSLRASQRKRFYKTVDVSAVSDGFAVTLDGKPVLTPARKPLVVPAREIAEAMAAEWTIQQEVIDPLTMPLTRLANSVLDAVVDRVDAVAADAAKYFETDLVFYRAGHPEALVEREGRHWDPVVTWAARALGAHFILAQGIVHVRQPEQAVAAARSALPRDAWSVAAVHIVTTLTGSALLALALFHRVLDEDEVWRAAHVDEDWNSEQWGSDAEVEARRAARLADFRAAARVLEALRPRAG